MKRATLVLSMLFIVLCSKAQTDIIYPIDTLRPPIENCKITDIVDGNFVYFEKDGYGVVQAGKVVLNGETKYLIGEYPIAKRKSIQQTNDNISLSKLLDSERKSLVEINQHLREVRIKKTIGISSFIVGGIMVGVGVNNNNKALYYTGGVLNLAGTILWIISPTKHIAYQRDLTIKRIKDLKNMSTDLSLSITQPKDMVGLGLALHF